MKRTCDGFAHRVPACGVLALVASFAAPGAALAQAWVAPAGVGAVSFVYQTIANTGHRLTDGSNLEGYDSSSRGMLLDVDYAITDRFSLAVGLPYIAAKYTGPLPSFAGEVDECRCWHHGWQDFGATARYNLVNGAFALTPSVSFGVPSHDYAYFGEAVVGRNLKELRLALDAGRRLDAIHPHCPYRAAIRTPSSKRCSTSRTTGATRRLKPACSSPDCSPRAWCSRGTPHGGLTSVEVDTPEEFEQYDRVLRDNNFHIGGGVAYSFPRIDLFMSYVQYVSGEDTHAGRVITAGFSWPFERQ